MSRYSDVQEIDEALIRLEQSHSRDQYEDRLGELAKLARLYPEEIIAVYNAGGFEQMPLIWCLQGQSSAPVIELFHEALQHKDQYVRWAAAEGLDKSGRTDLTEVFIRALKDRSHLVKCVAVGYLKRHGDDRALLALKHLLSLKSVQSHSPGIVKEAEEAIEAIRKRST